MPASRPCARWRSSPPCQLRCGTTRARSRQQAAAAALHGLAEGGSALLLPEFRDHYARAEARASTGCRHAGNPRLRHHRYRIGDIAWAYAYHCPVDAISSPCDWPLVRRSENATMHRAPRGTGTFRPPYGDRRRTLRREKKVRAEFYNRRLSNGRNPAGPPDRH